jgi:hypothetical protein
VAATGGSPPFAMFCRQFDQCLLRAVKPISRSQWNDGFGADSGPSQGDSRRRAIRPTEASKAAVCYVRNTSILLKNPLFWCQHLGFVAMSARQIPGSPPHVAKMGAGSGMSFASFRRFWAVAAKRNSSLAHLGHGGAIDRA